MSADELTAQLARDVRDFVRLHRWPILAAAAAGVLAHGVALANVSLSADEELLVVQPGLSGMEVGRPVMTLVKVLTRDLMPLPFWNTAIALTLLLVAGVLFAFLLMRAAGRPEPYKAPVTLFLIIFLTLPLTAFLMMWGEAAIAFAFGLALAAMAAMFAWLWAAEGWGRTAALAAFAMAFFTILTYQAQIFVALAGALAANIAYQLRPGSVSGLRDEVVLTLRLMGPVVAGGALGGVMALALVLRGQGGSDYHSGLLGWGDAPVSEVLGAMVGQVVDYATGEGFYGGWVLVPTVIVAGVLLLQLARRVRRGASWWAMALLLGLLLAPFGASFLLGTALPLRAMHAMPLVAGSVWLLWALTVRRAALRTGLLVMTAVALTVWHSNVTSHLYHVEISTFETDRSIASAIAERLASQGWDGSRIPFVSVGTRPRTLVEDIEGGDAFGLSSFNELQGGIRAMAFMQAMGHPLDFSSPEVRENARPVAATMPVWPADGAVRLQDGVAIVKFSEPTEPSEP